MLVNPSGGLTKTYAVANYNNSAATLVSLYIIFTASPALMTLFYQADTHSEPGYKFMIHCAHRWTHIYTCEAHYTFVFGFIVDG